MKKMLGFALLTAFAISFTSCCCDRNPCCDPCPPAPRCCEPKPCCPKPVCPPRCEPRVVENNCCY